MDIEKQFDFLVKDYGLKHVYQEFNNCYGGYWWVYTHSYYNDSGCFTIHNLPQRAELDFYYAKKFSKIRENLCERSIDISSIEKEICNKHNKILEVLAEVIKVEIIKKGEFFGIKV